MFENPRRGRQARNFTTNAPKILDLKSSSAQIFSKNWRWVPLRYFSVYRRWGTKKCFTKGIKTLYCNSVGFCSLFFCIPIRIEIEKFIDCCAFSINWNILEQIFYFNSMIGLIEIVLIFTIQFYIKNFQKWVRSIYNTTLVICAILPLSAVLFTLKLIDIRALYQSNGVASPLLSATNLYPSFYWRAKLFPSQKQHLRIFQYTLDS